jgi:hypothetical protein
MNDIFAVRFKGASNFFSTEPFSKALFTDVCYSIWVVRVLRKQNMNN